MRACALSVFMMRAIFCRIASRTSPRRPADFLRIPLYIAANIFPPPELWEFFSLDAYWVWMSNLAAKTETRKGKNKTTTRPPIKEVLWARTAELRGGRDGRCGRRAATLTLTGWPRERAKERTSHLVSPTCVKRSYNSTPTSSAPLTSA